MTRWDRFFSYFPLLLTSISFFALWMFARDPTGWSVLFLLGVLYLLPPLILRIVLRWSKIEAGVFKIDGRKFSPWLASHHIQAFYDALPQLESLLRVIPGFYSMWLRLWGSRVGHGVEWPVRMDVLDRNLMDIGNRVVFSHEVELTAHVRRKLEAGQSRVLVRTVRVASHAFVGVGVRMGPGACAPPSAQVPSLTVVGVNETYGEGVRHPKPEEAEFALM